MLIVKCLYIHVKNERIIGLAYKYYRISDIVWKQQFKKINGLKAYIHVICP